MGELVPDIFGMVDLGPAAHLDLRTERHVYE